MAVTIASAAPQIVPTTADPQRKIPNTIMPLSPETFVFRNPPTDPPIIPNAIAPKIALPMDDPPHEDGQIFLAILPHTLQITNHGNPGFPPAKGANFRVQFPE
jgi:hypothetical protein